MTSHDISSPLAGMEIAPDITVDDWHRLQETEDDRVRWAKEIRILDARIRRRFIEPVDVLIAHEIGLERGAFGFAILAIDCLLVETLQGFREGPLSHDGQSKRLFRTFLGEQLTDHFKDGKDAGSKADQFYARCRCGIHHSGQTDGDFRVLRSGPLILFNANDDSVFVNRTAFHDALKQVFDRYQVELADPSQGQLRSNFRQKMNSICGLENAA